MNKVIVPANEILKYYKDISKNGYALKPEYAARHFGIRTDTVRVKLRELVAKAEGAGTSYRKNFVYCQGMKRG